MARLHHEHSNGTSYEPGYPAAPPRNYSRSARAHADESIDLAQLWGAIRDNLRVVLLVAGGVFALVMTYTMASHMTFRSTCRLYLGELASKAMLGSNELDLSSAANSEVGSEIEVLRSRTMIERAVLSAGLNVQIAPPAWKPPRYWQWLLSRRDHRLLDVAAKELVATDTSLDEELKTPQEYRVKFTSETDFHVSAEGQAPVYGRLGLPVQVKGLHLTLLEGKNGGPKVGAEFGLTVYPLDDVIDDALSSLQVTAPKPASGGEAVRVLTLDFASKSPGMSAAFLEHLMRSYLEARQAWKTEDAAAAETFVTKQLRTMQQSLDNTQEKLAEYRAGNRVVVLGNEAEAMVGQIGKYEEQRVAARLQVASLRDIKRALKNTEAPLEAYLFGEASDDVLKQLGASLAEARQKQTELESRFKGPAPEVQQQRKQVEAQLGMIGNYVNSRLARAENNLASINGIIDQFETKLKTVPSAELGLAQIGREAEVYSRMYSYLLERQQQAAIIKASTVSKNRVLDRPEVPMREDSPKLGLHMASGIIGLLLGAALVIVGRLFSGVFRSESEVRASLGSLTIFASIPQRHKARAKQTDSASAPLFDILAPPSDIRFAEGFRSLRTNIYRTLPDGHGRVILVTSPNPGDGKTTCALSLAAMLAADNRRVLVIDADVRKPKHHTVTGLKQEPGLRDLVLRVKAGWKDVVQCAELSQGSFDAISAGAAAQAEVLSDGYLSTFLVNVRSHYEFVIVDAPSYPMVSDLLVLAPMTDFVISVVRLGNTPRKLAEEHFGGVIAAARGYAVVINNAERASAYGYPELPRAEAQPARGILEAGRQRLQW